MGGIVHNPLLTEFINADFPLPGAATEWTVNDDREATTLEYEAVTRSYLARIADHYKLYTGPAVANLAAYNALPAYAKVVPFALQRPFVIALCMEAATHGTSRAVTTEDEVNVGRTTANTYSVRAYSPVNARNGNAVGFAMRILNWRDPNVLPLAWAACAAAPGTNLRVDYSWCTDACQAQNITPRQYFRRVARAFFFAMGKVRRIRFEMGKQAGIPPAYGYLGTDFFDTVNMTVIERAVYDAYKQVMLFRSARTDLLNSSNMYTGGRNTTGGAAGRFPALGR